MAVSRRSQALRLYMNAIRAIRKVFGGDSNALRMSTTQARQMFESNRNLTDDGKIDAALREGRDGIDFLGQHIVQGVMEKQNTYSIKVEKHHGASATPASEDDDELAAFEAASSDVRESGPHTSTLHIRTAQDSLNPLPEEGGCCGGHDHDHTDAQGRQ